MGLSQWVQSQSPRSGPRGMGQRYSMVPACFFERGSRRSLQAAKHYDEEREWDNFCTVRSLELKARVLRR